MSLKKIADTLFGGLDREAMEITGSFSGGMAMILGGIGAGAGGPQGAFAGAAIGALAPLAVAGAIAAGSHAATKAYHYVTADGP